LENGKKEEIYFIGLKELIKNKEVAGRYKDFLKNLNKFNSTEANIKIEKILLYAGDTSIDFSDIQVVTWNNFQLILDRL